VLATFFCFFALFLPVTLFHVGRRINRRFGRKNRLTRWFVFEPKIAVWVNFGRKMLAYIMTIWNILRPFGVIYGRFVINCDYLVYFFLLWYVLAKKNLTTLIKNCFVVHSVATL
jgi:hypothetical protein